ncbi:SWI/SNF complex subunit SMARCC2-like isoform X2 [Halichondria panicea]|uniref:SWI/SNF complex subunit SMARCC2-like isoform X2 n=1 Tax=Halichondria panicea TaxID=6063 RepID=UPI00312BC7B1
MSTALPVPIRKKSGGPDTKQYENNETVSSFEGVRQWLIKNCKKHTQAEPPTNKQLAALTFTMLQFQEDAFGRQVVKPALTKIPVRLFEDLQPGGALSTIMATAFRVKSEQNWRRFDFHSPSRMDRGLELFMNIRKDLAQARHWEPPRVFLDSSVADTQRLLEVVKRHQGVVVERVEEASHVVYPAPPPSPPEEEYLRPLDVRGKAVLVHWWYFPDSYDTIVPIADVVMATPEAPPPSPKQWLVSAQWLSDTDHFNEWMNEEDYELIPQGGQLQLMAPHLGITRRTFIKTPAQTDDTLSQDTPEGGRKDRGARKRQRQPSPSPPAPTQKRPRKRASTRRSGARLRSTSEASEEDFTKHLPTPSQPLTVTEVTHPPSTPGGDDIIELRSPHVQTTPTPQPPPPVSRPFNPVPPSKNPEEAATPQTHHIVIPSYSSWFDYHSVHTIEKRSLPEFFSGKNRSKTPEIYLAYRNFMVDSFRLNPSEYLSVTACRRNLAGDVGAILRVHGFLEQWGLVNYHIEGHSQMMGPPTTAHFNVQVDTPMGVQPLPSANNKGQSPAQKSATDQLVQLPEKEGNKERNPLENVGLRTDMYSAADKEGNVTTKKPWTPQETLLLLEGLEMCRDDWNKVAIHVGTRTQDECILHFLKLPIEDPYLEENKESLGPLAHQPIPFSQQGNPVMSTVAFLASVVDPRIAAAAAKAALAEFVALKDELPDKTRNTTPTEQKTTPTVEKVAPKEEKTTPTGDKTTPTEETPKAREDNGSPVEKKPKDVVEPMDEDKLPLSSSEPPPPQPSGEGQSSSSEGVGNVSTAAAAALASAAVKAKHLANVEERKIKSLVALLVETQMKKLEIKLKHFEELEAIMDRERESLELQRQQLLSDRQQFQRDQVKAAEMRSLQSPTLAPQTPLQLPPVLRPPPKSIPPAEPIPILSDNAPSTTGTGTEESDGVAMETTPSEPITMETAPPEKSEESNAKVPVNEDSPPIDTKDAEVVPPTETKEVPPIETKAVTPTETKEVTPTETKGEEEDVVPPTEPSNVETIPPTETEGEIVPPTDVVEQSETQEEGGNKEPQEVPVEESSEVKQPEVTVDEGNKEKEEEEPMDTGDGEGDTAADDRHPSKEQSVQEGMSDTVAVVPPTEEEQ